MITFRMISYLKLLRFPAVFTSIADIICGYFIVSSTWEREIVYLLISSSLLYMSGMVMNDYYDYEQDKVQRPERPLPSGNIPRLNALYIGIVFSGAGVAFAYMAGMTSFFISIVLLGAIFLYNGVTKDIFILGPLNMGACRFLNMVLGMSVALKSGGWEIVFPSLLMIYITGLTILSGVEATGGSRKDIFIMSLLPIGVVIAVTAFFSFNGYFASMAPMLFLIPFGLIVAYHFRKIFLQPDKENIQHCVKVLILLIILLDAVFISGFKGAYYGALVTLLLAPSVMLARLIYIT